MTGTDAQFDPCRRLPLDEALRAGLLTVEKTLSPLRTEALAPPFAFNPLTFQYAVWGHMVFTELGERHCSTRQAIAVLRVPGGRVVAQDGAVLLHDGSALDALLQFVQVHTPDSFFRSVDGQLRLRRADATKAAGSYFLGLAPASQNYAHWLTCTLPSWRYFRDALLPTGAKLIVGPCGRFHTEALELLGIPADALFRMPLEIVAFDQLAMLSPIDLWQTGDYVGETGRAIAAIATAADDRPGPRRVYLTRRDVASRRLLNEAQAEAMLTRRGFVSLTCSELSFAEQVRHMAGADLVVGLHGSALANIAFCRSGTRVIEVFPEYCVQPAFRVLAHLARLRFGFVQGTSFEPESARAANTAWDSDFVIDVSRLEAAIDEAERLGGG